MYLSLIFVSLITMCLGVFLLGFILPGALCFLDLVDYFFSPVWEVFSSYLFKYFLRSFPSLFSFWDPYSVNVVLLMLSRALLGCFHFFPSFFYILFCGRDCHHSVLQVVYMFFHLGKSAIDSFSVLLICLFFSSSRSLVNISYIFSILFLDPGWFSLSLFWILFLEVFLAPLY